MYYMIQVTNMGRPSTLWKVLIDSIDGSVEVFRGTRSKCFKFMSENRKG